MDRRPDRSRIGSDRAEPGPDRSWIENLTGVLGLLGTSSPFLWTLLCPLSCHCCWRQLLNLGRSARQKIGTVCPCRVARLCHQVYDKKKITHSSVHRLNLGLDRRPRNGKSWTEDRTKVSRSDTVQFGPGPSTEQP